jgi:hypothetical protein
MRPFLIAAVVVAAPAFAGTLRNADPHEYRLRIKAAGRESNVPINTTSTLEKTCGAFPCDIENEDTGDVVRLTSADESLDIKGGRFALAGATVAREEEPKVRHGESHHAAKKHGKMSATKKAKTRHARHG